MTTDKPAGAGTKEEKRNGSKMYKLHGGFTTPLEGSLANQSCDNKKPCLADTIVSPDTDNGEQNKNAPKEDWNTVWLLDEATGTSSAHPGAEQLDIAKVFKPTILTRKTNPHNPAQVKTILVEITISQDLSLAQWEQVCDLISEHAECFTLSMSEVTTVEGAAHHLDIPRDKQF